ncbi:hypothetical protein D3C87_1979590 [compost metagenome]
MMAPPPSVTTTAPILWVLSVATASASVSVSGRVWTVTPLVCRMVSTSMLNSSFAQRVPLSREVRNRPQD